MTEKIRVLVVDDSMTIRKRICDIINADPQCEVVAAARNGEEALSQVATLRPDVVTLDIRMPGMDGLTVLQYIVSEWPTPVIVLTGFTRYAGVETIKCLEYGALDFMSKVGLVEYGNEAWRQEFLGKIKGAVKANLLGIRPKVERYKALSKRPVPGSTKKVVVIAASTGGPRTLTDVLPRLPGDLPACIIVVQHMPAGFTGSLARRLDWESQLKISEAENGNPVLRGSILIAPGDFHLVVRRSNAGMVVALNEDAREHGVRPAADVTMRSLAPLYGPDCLGIVMTGMGNDGVEGLRAIKAHGGRTFAEDKSTCVIYGMPKAAFDAGVVDEVHPADRMAEAISRWCGK